MYVQEEYKRHCSLTCDSYSQDPVFAKDIIARMY